MRHRLPVVAVVAVVLLGFYVSEARSQGSSGLFGSRSVGGGISAGNRTLGGTGQSLGSITTQGQDDVGQVDSSARYMRDSSQSGSFVGTSSEDVRNAFLGAIQAGQNSGTQGRGGLGAGMQRPGGMGRGNQQGTGGTGRGTGRSRGDVPTSLSVAFDFPQPRATAIGTGLAQRLSASHRIQAPSGVTVEVDAQGTATLRGVVATSRDRDLCEQLARLEAGIWSVRNDLVVEESPEEEAPATPN